MATTEHANSGQLGLRLGGARADFVAGLGRKVSDLRSCGEKVRHAPSDIACREELRRKLQALWSSSKLMKCEAMHRALTEALGTLDRCPIDAPLQDTDLSVVASIIEDLPTLAWGESDTGATRVSTVRPRPQRVYSALLVGSPHVAEALVEPASETRDALTPGTQGPLIAFACESTPTAQGAFDIARSTEPDIVILDADLDDAIDVTDQLLSDPLTDSLPIVVIGSFLEPGEAERFIAMGVTRTLPKPTSKASVREACEKALRAHAPPADTTVRPGTHKPLGNLPSANTNVGSVPVAPSRTTLHPTTSNETSFGDRTRARLRGPAAEVRLKGRRILVADDDPAVVWFFADLLKNQGCSVYEAFSGAEALDVAFRNSPDLVLCDIMLPGHDGFMLSRALRRDVALRDVPVVLLSWREDLLHRARELGAQAAGYLRKESDTRAVIARLREALRPRACVELRLREENEVRGRIDGMTVRSLLEIVCSTRPEARVSVKDACFTYTLDIRDGAPLRAVRTGAACAPIEGPRVLGAMLGVSSGRFIVTTSAGAIEAHLSGDLKTQLASHIARARAVSAMITGPAAMRVRTLHFDDALLADYLHVMPPHACTLARQLQQGASPRDLITSGEWSASLIEDLLHDIAIRGLVIAAESDAPTSDASSIPPLVSSPEPSPVHGRPKSDAQALGRAAKSADIADPVAAALSCPSPEPLPVDEATVLDHTTYLLKQRESNFAKLETTVPARLNPVNTRRAPEQTRVDAGVNVAPDVNVDVDADADADADAATEARITSHTPLACEVSERPQPNKGSHVARKRAFLATLGVIVAVLAWAAMRSPVGAASPPAPKPRTASATLFPSSPRSEEPGSPVPGAEDVTYTHAPTETEIATGQGLLEVSAPDDSVIVIDGEERGRGGVTVALWGGAHEVRVSDAKKDRAHVVDVRAGQVAHVNAK